LQSVGRPVLQGSGQHESALGMARDLCQHVGIIPLDACSEHVVHARLPAPPRRAVRHEHVAINAQ